MIYYLAKILSLPKEKLRVVSKVDFVKQSAEQFASEFELVHRKPSDPIEMTKITL